MKFAFTPFVIRRGTHLNCRGWPVSICLLAAAVQKRRSKGRYIEERRRFHPSASECSSLFVFFLVVSYRFIQPLMATIRQQFKHTCIVYNKVPSTKILRLFRTVSFITVTNLIRLGGALP
jgi:hypothetical protein